VYWDKDDQITVFSKNTGFSFKTSSGGDKVHFVGTVNVEDATYHALYPYDESATFDGTTLTTTLQDEQVVDDDLESTTNKTCSFAIGANITVASTLAADMALSFKNVCGLINFSIHEEVATTSDLPFSKATLQGNNSENLSGEITIKGVGTNTPVGNISGSGKTITLKKNDGPFKKDFEYFIVVPPKTFSSSGYKITFSNVDGSTTAVWDVAGAKTVNRSKILKAGSDLEAGVYNIPQYTITVAANYDNRGTVTKSSNDTKHNIGTQLTLTATHKDGYKFTKWDDGNTDNPRTVKVTADHNYTATFEAL
jgi:hypothetical protein